MISRRPTHPIRLADPVVKSGDGDKTINGARANEGSVTVTNVATSRRQSLPVVYWRRPRCPKCGGVSLFKYRSLADQGDGSAAWWVRCTNEMCGHRFRIVLE